LDELPYYEFIQHREALADHLKQQAKESSKQQESNKGFKLPSIRMPRFKKP